MFKNWLVGFQIYLGFFLCGNQSAIRRNLHIEEKRQDRKRHDMTGQERSEHERIGGDRIGYDRPGKYMTGQNTP